MTRRVLFVSYAFPPVGGAGVQRVTKFAKYLPRAGWEVSVLTVLNPSVPLLDKSLLNDIPEQTIIRRAKTLEPSYAVKAAVAEGRERAAPKGLITGVKRLAGSIARRSAKAMLQPDPQILWNINALREGLNLLRETPHDAIIASGPPFSSFLLAAKLSRKSGIPLVLDYRDEWGISNAYLENKKLGFTATRIQNAMQRRVMRQASAILATTGQSAANLESLASACGSRATISHIYNGFDPDDFRDISAPTTNSDRRRITYTGTLWNLTDISPLVEAVTRLAQRRPDLAARLDICIAGRNTPAQQAILDQLRPLPCTLDQHAYLDHHDVIRLFAQSDALVALQAALPGSERVVSAKIFEYMAAGRPILTIAPHGELWQLLDGHPAAARFEPAQIDAISQWLEQLIQHPRPQAAPSSDWNPARFSRECQARELAGLLSAVAPGRHPAPPHSSREIIPEEVHAVAPAEV